MTSTLQKYRKIESDRIPSQKNEIRISAKQDQIGKYIGYALLLLNNNEFPEICVRGTGAAIAKVCLVSEILRQRKLGLALRTSIINNTIDDVYEPLEEGLDRVVVAKNLVVLEIVLSSDQHWKDQNKDKIGYQAELPEDQVHAQERRGPQHGGQRRFGGGRNREGQRAGGYKMRGGHKGGRRRSQSGDRVCYNCNKPGHISRECPEEHVEREREPRRNEQRRRSHERGGEKVCYNCNNTGHIAKECPEERKQRGGHGEQHERREGRGNFQQRGGKYGGGRRTSSRDNRQQVCYNCNRPGHKSNECHEEPRERPPRNQNREPRDITCYNCNKQGHRANDCNEERRERGGHEGEHQRPRKYSNEHREQLCYECNKPGHQKRDCPKLKPHH